MARKLRKDIKNPELINWNLRDARLERGLTLNQVADAVGCTEMAINHYELMKHNPSRRLAEKVARFYEMTVDELFPEDILYAITEKRKEEVRKRNFKQRRRNPDNYWGVGKKMPIRHKGVDLRELEKLCSNGNAFSELGITREELHKAITELPKSYRILIEKKFGLNGQEPKTFRELGESSVEILSRQVTRQRVEQVYEEALEVLKIKLEQQYL